MIEILSGGAARIKGARVRKVLYGLREVGGQFIYIICLLLADFFPAVFIFFDEESFAHELTMKESNELRPFTFGNLLRNMKGNRLNNLSGVGRF